MTRIRGPRPIGRALRSRFAPAAIVTIGLSLLCGTRTEAAAQAVGHPRQTIDRPRLVIRVDTARVNVGDQVTLHVQAALPAGTRLVDATPVAREPLADGIRILHTDPLRMDRDGSASGTLTVVMFRPGSARMPPLGVTYQVTPGSPVDTLVADAVTVTVTPVVPIGSGTLRDIKDLDVAPIPPRIAATAAVVALAALALALVARRITRRRRVVPIAAGDFVAEVGGATGPYAVALVRLAAIGEDWATRHDIDSHYGRTTDVLRRYLHEAHGIPALERTTAELLVVLPAPVAGPHTRTAARAMLGVADLVKFARYDPRPPAPADLLQSARSLLAAWDAADTQCWTAAATSDRAAGPGCSPRAGGAGRAIR